MRSQSLRMCPQIRSVCAEGSCRNGADELNGARLDRTQARADIEETKEQSDFKTVAADGDFNRCLILSTLSAVVRCVKMPVDQTPDSFLSPELP
jgi:hypothetical protein